MDTILCAVMQYNMQYNNIIMSTSYISRQGNDKCL